MPFDYLAADEPDFNIEGPKIEWVSYGPSVQGPIMALYITVLALIIVLVF